MKSYVPYVHVLWLANHLLTHESVNSSFDFCIVDDLHLLRNSNRHVFEQDGTLIPLLLVDML